MDKLSKNEVRYLDEIVNRHREKPGPLMLVLHDVQKTFGCVSYDTQKYISKQLKISLSKIYSVITFYSQFSVKPSGKYSIGVCMGTACYVKGAMRILDKVFSLLGVGLGETTKDGLFTIAPTRCLGDCSKAPALMIGDEVYSNLSVEDIEDIIVKYK